MIGASTPWTRPAASRPVDTYDPAHDVDHIAVERAAAGTYAFGLLTTEERTEAVAMLRRAGLSRRDIADRLQTGGPTYIDHTEVSTVTRGLGRTVTQLDR